MPADINPWVTAYHRGKSGYQPDPLFVDFPKAFTDDPALEQAARAELARLESTTTARRLNEHDHESKIRWMALRRMLSDFDARNA